MNRLYRMCIIVRSSVPHTRGDEPRGDQRRIAAELAFPTPVGMNRSRVARSRNSLSVPHTRGDEPGRR